MYPYMKALALQRLALCSLQRRAEAKGGQGMFAATPANRSGAQICAGFRERP